MYSNGISEEKKMEMYFSELEIVKSNKEKLANSTTAKEINNTNTEDDLKKDEELSVAKVEDIKRTKTTDSKIAKTEIKETNLKNVKAKAVESEKQQSESKENVQKQEELKQDVSNVEESTKNIDNKDKKTDDKTEDKTEETTEESETKNIITLSATRITLDDFVKVGVAHLYVLTATDTSKEGGLHWEMNSPDKSNLFFDQISGNEARLEYSNYINYGDVIITVTNTTTGAKATCILDTSMGNDGDLEETSNMIEFTIDGKSYSAEKDMNWIDWVNSSYNSDFVFAQSYVFRIENVYLIPENYVQRHTYDNTPENLDGIGNVFNVFGEASYVAIINKNNIQSCEKIIDGYEYSFKTAFLGDKGELPIMY